MLSEQELDLNCSLVLHKIIVEELHLSGQQEASL